LARAKSAQRCASNQSCLSDKGYERLSEDLDNTIRDNAAGPRRAAGDSGSMEQHSLSEQIEADRYLASKTAARSGSLGIRKAKLVPPGAV